METYQIILLAIVQGLTEFLPISSSAHLILPSELLGWPDQGQAFDVAVHVGSLAAVMLYLRRELIQITKGSNQGVLQLQWNKDLAMAFYIVLATIPVVLVGVLFERWIEAHLRSGLVIAAATLIFGAVLWWADASRKEQLTEDHLNWRHALVIGLAQVLALIPGTSRSGITITAALFLGFRSSSAARFSFLLSIPAIGGAGSLKTYELMQNPENLDAKALYLGIGVSFVSAYACIYWFLKLVDQIGMKPFVIYRMALGVLLLLLLAF